MWRGRPKKTRFECVRAGIGACSIGPQKRESCGLVFEMPITISRKLAAVKLSHPVDKDGKLCSS